LAKAGVVAEAVTIFREEEKILPWKFFIRLPEAARALLPLVTLRSMVQVVLGSLTRRLNCCFPAMAVALVRLRG
jgi:hypothetical protein